MSENEEILPPAGTVPKRRRGCVGSFVFMMLLGLGVLILTLVAIDATDSGGAIKKKLVTLLGGETEPRDEPARPKPEVVEKVVEVPVEKIVEKVVEKVVEVEVQPPLPSGYVAWKKVDVGELWSEIPVETEVVTSQGETAFKERERDESYRLEMTLHLTVPKPNESVEELAAINPELPAMLPDFGKLVGNAEVSPFFHKLYELKTEYVQQRITRIDQILSRHNLYDLETALHAEHPDSGRKVLIVQGEMDVVSDGSDGDRWPELDDYITMSQYYQPFTSYGWTKRTSTPNPLLARWEENLAKYEEEFKIKGLSIERNRYLRSQIETLGPEIEDMKARSYLIAEADPFFVLPLSFLGYRDETPFAPSIGDYGVIVHEGKLYPAIAGDAGPSWKFGEASLRIAKEISEKASPYNRPVSDLTVTYLIFPGSADETRGPPDLEKWHARCSELMEEIGGIGEGYSLHEWEDLIAKKKAEQEAAEKAAAEAEKPAEETADQPAQPKPEGEGGESSGDEAQ